MWIIQFIKADTLEWPMVLTCALGVVNALLLPYVLYKVNATTFFITFPCLFLLYAYACCPQLSCAWRGQIAVSALLLSFWALSGVDWKHEPIHETYYSTIVLVAASFALPHIILFLAGIIGVLIYKSMVTRRALSAMAIALIMGAIMYAFAFQMGWLPSMGVMWSMNYATAWIIIALTAVVVAIMFLMLRFPSVVTGVAWLIAVALGAANFGIYTFNDIL